MNEDVCGLQCAVDVPMDVAVFSWRLIHDDDFRGRWEGLISFIENRDKQQAKEILTAHAAGDVSQMLNLIDKMDPNTGTLSALLVQASVAQKSDSARGAALHGHRHNHAKKEEVFQWLNANMSKYKSMDAATEAITKLQPYAYRTLRKWVGDWKKLRSTGTA